METDKNVLTEPDFIKNQLDSYSTELFTGLRVSLIEPSGKKSQEFFFNHGFTAGRSQDNDIVIQNSEISRRHLKVKREHKNWWIYDMNSANGIYVQSELVNRRLKLNFPALVSIGESGISLHIQATGQCIDADQKITKDNNDFLQVKGGTDIYSKRNKSNETIIARLFGREEVTDASDYTRMMRVLIHADRTHRDKNYKKAIWGISLLFLMSFSLVTRQYTLDRGLFTAIENKTNSSPVSTLLTIDQKSAQANQELLLSHEGAAPEELSGPKQIPPMDLWKNIDFGNYYALIIGNNHYKKIQSLDTPIKDAQEVDKILREKYGFNTKLLVDADRYQILTAMNELRAKLTENDNLLIYYAGHGELDRVNMRGQWLPVDADADNNANWISTESITDILNAMSPRHILVVADSCYSGTLTRSALTHLAAGMSNERKVEWVKAMVKGKSRTALTSGGLKPVMDGGGGDHSVFANAFIKALQDNNNLLEGQELYRLVSSNVIAAAEQVPQYDPIKFSGHEVGDFFFIPNNNKD